MEKQPQKQIMQKGCTTYFTKQFERTLFFIMTLIMLGWGLWEKIMACITQ